MAAATYPSSDILIKQVNKFTAIDFTFTRKTQKPCDSDPIITTSPTKSQGYTCNLSPKLGEVAATHAFVFNVEETLLKYPSWFPFFMLVAFEGGGLLRALLLLLLYPFLCLMGHELKLKIMVFVCFFGIKRKSFRIGRTVLPKFLLEDVGYQGFELVMRFGKRVAVSNFPRVMVEGFVKDYLGIETVIGRELKVFEGYYVGLMEDKEVTKEALGQVLGDVNKSQIIAMAGSLHSIHNYSTNFKEIYLVNEGDKEKWQYLPKDKYPKPLIFHDGRLAFLPTPLTSLVMFIWLPFGVFLCIIRLLVSQFLPYKISIPILAFLGTSAKISRNNSQTSTYLANNNEGNTNSCDSSKGIVYVCNHKTLIDPIYISFSRGVPLTALTYSISKTSQVLSPIKTVTLTRDREKDAEIMSKMLNKGSVVVCPEGTTCREPYLLRFSPLFAEISDDIVPVAMEVKVSMFYGTTASGFKALDPIVFLLNPYPFYLVKYLEKLPKSHTCGAGGMSKFEVANYVQSQIGKALGYKCTGLTRKDKYFMLAGNALGF